MSEREDRIHVVLFPWLAFGHMIPYLDLSIALAKSEVHVSYISTPRNIQRLPKVPTNVSPLIDFVPFPLPRLSSHPLPENAEATTDIPADKMECLKMAADLLQEPIRNFIAEKRPDWIIVDFFSSWAAGIAREFNIPLVFFNMLTASTMVFFCKPHQDLTVPPDCVEFPSQVAYKQHEVSHANFHFVSDATGMSTIGRLNILQQASQAICLRSSMELEGDYFKLYRNLLNSKAVFPLGFLPPEKLEGRRTMREEPWSEIFEWLDKQQPRSVVFVGFGSECKLKKEEIYEIAKGVELSGLPFMWALRKPEWAKDEIEALPPGFVFRTQGRGVVQMGWAPQREILAHPSVGGSLFHAGWASVVETIIYGHCLVLLPMVITQPLDARLMVEKGLGIEVKRGEDGSLTGKDIADSLRKAMDSKEGEALRQRTKEAAEGMFGNQQLNDGYINKFVEYLKTGAQQQQPLRES